MAKVLERRLERFNKIIRKNPFISQKDLVKRDDVKELYHIYEGAKSKKQIRPSLIKQDLITALDAGGLLAFRVSHLKELDKRFGVIPEEYKPLLKLDSHSLLYLSKGEFNDNLQKYNFLAKLFSFTTKVTPLHENTWRALKILRRYEPSNYFVTTLGVLNVKSTLANRRLVTAGEAAKVFHWTKRDIERVAAKASVPLSKDKDAEVVDLFLEAYNKAANIKIKVKHFDGGAARHYRVKGHRKPLKSEVLEQGISKSDIKKAIALIENHTFTKAPFFYRKLSAAASIDESVHKVADLVGAALRKRNSVPLVNFADFDSVVIKKASARKRLVSALKASGLELFVGRTGERNYNDPAKLLEFLNGKTGFVSRDSMRLTLGWSENRITKAVGVLNKKLNLINIEGGAQLGSYQKVKLIVPFDKARFIVAGHLDTSKFKRKGT